MPLVSEIAKYINEGLALNKLAYAEKVYEKMFELSQATMGCHAELAENYLTCTLPIARYVVERTSLPYDLVAARLDSFIKIYSKVDEETKKFSLQLSEEMKKTYPYDGNIQSEMAILACEFISTLNETITETFLGEREQYV
jgi:hypothetical protein